MKKKSTNGNRAGAPCVPTSRNETNKKVIVPKNITSAEQALTCSIGYL